MYEDALAQIFILIIQEKIFIKKADFTHYFHIKQHHRTANKTDVQLTVMGKVSEDRFPGGLRITAEGVMNIATARVQFGKQFSISVTAPADLEKIMTNLVSYLSNTGLPLITHYTGRCRYLQDSVGQRLACYTSG